MLVLLYTCYAMCPLLLNVGLSWLNNELSGVNFAVVLGMTFATGVVAFLLPPVPGMTVYIFGGLVVAGNCPLGFWWGAVINIGLCWLLKLTACAVQQKCIGGLLGRSLAVRQMVGVHKVTIRCIESVLRQPGLSLGKVAILCGGPDWPTSVLAGLLGLSLFQCELGTAPIVLFITPCALSGSLYLKKGEEGALARSADLMIVASVLVNAVLWGLAAWAIQSELEANYEEIKRPLPQNVDLEWLDYKAAEMAKRTPVTWSMVPRVVRSLFLIGAGVDLIIFQILYWGSSELFGQFEVSHHIDTLRWFGSEGLFTDSAIAVLATYFAAWACFIQFAIWKRCKLRAQVAAASKDLDASEIVWKEAWLKDTVAHAKLSALDVSASAGNACEVAAVGKPLCDRDLLVESLQSDAAALADAAVVAPGDLAEDAGEGEAICESDLLMDSLRSIAEDPAPPLT